MDNIVALEIRNREIYLVVGYVYNNNVNVIYSTTLKLTDVFNNTENLNVDSLVKDLKFVKQIKDLELKLDIKINEVYLILPSENNKVFSIKEESYTMSETSVVGKQDIVNLLHKITKHQFSDDESIVDIIPRSFQTDGTKWSEPPVGKNARLISIDTYVYTIPKVTYTLFDNIFEKTDIKIKRRILGPSAVSFYLKNSDFKPNMYGLCDIDDDCIKLTVCNTNYAFNCLKINYGLMDVIKNIADQMFVTVEQAKDLVKLFGIDYRKTDYDPVVSKSQTLFGLEKEFFKTETVQIINDAFKVLCTKIEEGVSQLLTKYPELVNTLPVVVYGKVNEFKGFEQFLTNKINKKIHFLKMQNLGCFDPKYTSCVTSILFASKYKGTLGEVLEKRELREQKKVVTEQKQPNILSDTI